MMSTDFISADEHRDGEWHVLAATHPAGCVQRRRYVWSWVVEDEETALMIRAQLQPARRDLHAWHLALCKLHLLGLDANEVTVFAAFYGDINGRRNETLIGKFQMMDILPYHKPLKNERAA